MTIFEFCWEKRDRDMKNKRLGSYELTKDQVYKQLKHNTITNNNAYKNIYDMVYYLR